MYPKVGILLLAAWISYTKGNMARNISIVGNEFMLDGQPLRIVSGSLHYFRLPASSWRDRLRKLKAAGLNTVSTYVEWSYHEPEEREYQFEEDRDVAEFVRIAAEEKLYVLLRPGPYICAERDLGGLPYWLLSKYPQIKLRSVDKNFIAETKIWMTKLFESLTPLLYGNGGPIILVQVENEYGSYGSDQKYKVLVRDILREHVGTNALLYTTDGTSASMIRGGAVAGTLTTIDFGTGINVKTIFKNLRSYMPEGPLMNSEFYPGWLTHWSEKFQKVSTEEVTKTLKDMLDNNINVNMYMFFGGTNFEFSAGANMGYAYQPDITSYDYDAPLTEAGDPTPKYYAIRELMTKYYPELKNITPPTPAPKGAYGQVNVTPQVYLMSPEGRSNLGKHYNDVIGEVLPTFEKLRQRSGLMLYETTLDNAIDGTNGSLEITKPRDRVYVYINGEYKGIIQRMTKSYTLNLNIKSNATLSLLVENQGRINYGSRIHDFKGILSKVKYNNKVLANKWTITGYPLEEVITSVEDETVTASGPVLHEGQFYLPSGQEPLDSFLDTSGWGKGYVWVNGHNLGRYWPGTGPQITLYVPGVWLHTAPEPNTLQILELETAPDSRAMSFIDHPILDRNSIAIPTVSLVDMRQWTE